MTSELPKQYQRQCEEARLAHITGWQKSGLSMRQYCKQRGLNVSTFSDWVKKMDKQTPAKFIPIELPAHQSKINSPQPKSLIIEFTNGIKVTLTAIQELKELLLLLRGI